MSSYVHDTPKIILTMDLFIVIISRVNEIGNRESLVRLDTSEKLYQHGAGILFRKEMLYRVNLYDTSIRNAEDYDLLIRLNKAKIKGFYLPVPLYRYYIHGANMTLNNDRNQSVQNVKRKIQN